MKAKRIGAYFLDYDKTCDDFPNKNVAKYAAFNVVLCRTSNNKIHQLF